MVDEDLPLVDTLHIYVDEAGDPNIFQRRGHPIVGTPGSSRFFIVGKLEVDDPSGLAEKLDDLRAELCANPYFAGVPAFDPARRRTAVAFHAKDDPAEVRLRVFDLLASESRRLRFQAVVIDKLKVLDEVRARAANTLRYTPNSLYDLLLRKLFGKFHRMADEYIVTIASRGQSNRNAALHEALRHAEADFESRFGFKRGPWKLYTSRPDLYPPLQAADYFLWALQRLYEPRIDERSGRDLREERFFGVVRPQVTEIHDMSFGPPEGTFFTRQRELTMRERFEGEKGKKS